MVWSTDYTYLLYFEPLNANLTSILPRYVMISFFLNKSKTYTYIYCDVTPLAASSQGHWPDRERKCSGLSSRIRKRVHPLLSNYLITVFFFLVIVSCCESDGEAEWLAVLFCIPREHRSGEEHQEKERVACPRKCRRRPRVKVAPSATDTEVSTV